MIEPQSKQKLGKKSENAACTWLRDRGYSILARNYRILPGEIDIIARKNRRIFLIEVRSRQGNVRPETIAESISQTKRNRIWMAGFSFLQKNGLAEIDIVMLLVIVVWPAREQRQIYALVVE